MIPYPIHSALDAHTYDSFIRYRPQKRRIYKGKVVQLGINRQKAMRALRNSVKHPYRRPKAGRPLELKAFNPARLFLVAKLSSVICSGP